jgi:hypothetical protein
MENAAAALKPKPPRGGKCAEEQKFIGAILDSAKAEPSACTNVGAASRHGHRARHTAGRCTPAHPHLAARSWIAKACLE